MKITRKVLWVLCGCLMFSAVARAQTQSTDGDFKYSAPKVTLRANGARLDGTAAQPARISSSQLNVTALAIAFDYSDKQIQQVRALGNVKLDVNMPDEKGVIIHVHATSDKATLNPLQRQLILEGNVDGYYQTPGGIRTTLAGSKAVINRNDEQTTAQLTGPVRLVIPPELLESASLGEIIITSQNASIDQATGKAIFSGDAHAISASGENRLNVSAPQFIVTRNADGTINTLQTQGKTFAKVDIPSNAPLKNVDTNTDTNKIGKPTYVEITSDAATIVRPKDKNATMMLTADGNVSGFYILQPVDKEPQRYNFSGDKAVFTQPVGSKGTEELQVDITGQPVTVFAPSFQLNMGKNTEKGKAEQGK